MRVGHHRIWFGLEPIAINRSGRHGREPRPLPVPGSTGFAPGVVGSSMSPLDREGDVVIVDRTLGEMDWLARILGASQ